MFFNHEESLSIGFEHIRQSISCRTPYGRALVRTIKPYTNANKSSLVSELNNIEATIYLLKNKPESMAKLENFFSQVRDIKRSIENCPDNTLDSVALFEIRRFLILLQHITVSVEQLNMSFEDIMIPNCYEALSLINPDKSFASSFHISDTYSKKLADIRKQKLEIEESIKRSKSEQDIEQLKIERLKVVDAEFEEELSIRRCLSQKIDIYKYDILLAIESIGRLDLIIQKAKLAILHNAIKPVIVSDDELILTDMHNPYFDSILKAHKRSFIPITLSLQSGVTVVTGANMGGKSMAIKTLALNTALAMCGFFVFASSAKIPFLEHICIIAQDYENAKGGLSSFGGEILKLKQVLKNVDSHSLMLFDEFAKGTNPEEGAQIVRALVKYLNKKKAISVIATHYNGAAIHAKKHYRVAGLKSFFEDELKEAKGNKLDIIAKHMDYGLYEAPIGSDCPKEAKNICRFILSGEEILEHIINETDNIA